MSHFHCEIYLPSIPDDVFSTVKKIMAPYREGENDGGFWDFYQIGGRWKGAHLEGYDSNQDPSNWERCDHPYVRHNRLTDSECSYCEKRGPKAGMRTAWPTQWQPHELDLISLKNLPKDFSCYTLIIDGAAFQKEKWNGEAFVEGEFDGNVKPFLARKGIWDGYLVTVDYHS